jgi:predicted ATPase
MVPGTGIDPLSMQQLIAQQQAQQLVVQQQAQLVAQQQAQRVATQQALFSQVVSPRKTPPSSLHGRGPICLGMHIRLRLFYHVYITDRGNICKFIRFSIFTVPDF